ncbi:MAG: hypothetical protein ABII12_14220 [Planctomycetota bacterium]
MSEHEKTRDEAVRDIAPAADAQLSDVHGTLASVRPSTLDIAGHQSGEAEGDRSSRRAFLGKTARKLAYAAPVALLFKPRQAVAASQGGSLITPGP